MVLATMHIRSYKRKETGYNEVSVVFLLTQVLLTLMKSLK
jgi:hypothetical protein